MCTTLTIAHSCLDIKKTLSVRSPDRSRGHTLREWKTAMVRPVVWRYCLSFINSCIGIHRSYQQIISTMRNGNHTKEHTIISGSKNYAKIVSPDNHRGHTIRKVRKRRRWDMISGWAVCPSWIPPSWWTDRIRKWCPPCAMKTTLAITQS